MNRSIKYGFVMSLIVIGLWSCGDDNIDRSKACEQDHFTSEVYAESIDSTFRVVYGENVTNIGVLQELRMDIFYPDDETYVDRPVMIWAFGGAFVAGKRQDMHAYAREWAKRGWVSAAIDYRILNVQGIQLDSVLGIRAAMHASNDMRAAIRHFRMDAANGNTYKIDPDQIYVGGLSAGAITAIQTAYFTQEDIDAGLEPHIEELLVSNGGLEGDSGKGENLNYTSEVAGVVNLSGAVYRLEWMDANDPPIYSYHGTADNTVKYGHGWVNLGSFDIVLLHGSGSLHPHAESIGLKNYLHTVEGGGHGDIHSSATYSSDRETFYTQVMSLQKEDVCQ